MSNAAKLKKKAAEFEQKKQLDKALVLYRQILDDADPSDPDVDVGLFNRVGDLLLRQGSVSDAVTYYEKAVDLYAEGGFFNNAIALCNKILRQSPGRSSIYYKLGKISAKKGFKSDAKQNFLEYADRMQKAGQLDEAFRALKEFADLCPDQDDIRLMLAEQLAKQDRKDEAMDQLQTLYERFEGEGRDTEARATLDRMKAIDPDAQPKAAVEGKKVGKTTDLVFLDVDYDPQPGRRPPPRATVKLPTPLAEDVVRPSSPSPMAGLPLIDVGSAGSNAGPEVPLQPAAFAAMRLGTPMDVPSHDRPSHHDLALPGDLPSLEMPASPPAGLDLIMPDDGEPFEDEMSLDGLVPPITRAASAPATLDTVGFELEPTSADSGLDAASLASMPGLDVQSTMLDDADAHASAIAPLAGFEQTMLDDDFDTGSLEMATDVDDEIVLLDDDGTDGDDLLIIDDESATLDDGGGITRPAAAERPMGRPAPDADDRTTRVLTPAELQAIDVAARAGAARPADDDEFGALDLAHELTDTPASAATARAESAVADLPMLETEVSRTVRRGDAARDDARDDARNGALGGDALELAEHLPVGNGAPVAAGNAARLRARVNAAPDDWGLRRAWAEALLDAGERESGLQQLDAAMVGAERSGNLELARSIADEVIRVDRDSVRHHQKRVEYAFRTADRPRLVDAYLELADSLFRMGQPDKARVVYQRVLELAPDDLRASAAITSISGVVPGAPKAAAAPVRTTTGIGRRYTAEAGRVVTPPENIVPVAPAPRSPAAARTSAPAAPVFTDADAEFVNLGDLLRSDDAPKSTRMVVAEQEPTGDEQADFADMLRMFKQGVAQNVEEEDYDSHYDLGVAYKEMGLVDEAIAQFQKALRGPSRRVRTYEALGQCFLEKKQWQVASTILQRALAEPGEGDEQLVGVLYLLGYAMEAQHKPQDALTYYQRVFAVDIQFRDVVDRLNAVEKVAR